MATTTQARTLYQQLYREYPTSARAAEARFNAAIIALAGGRRSHGRAGARFARRSDAARRRSDCREILERACVGVQSANSALASAPLARRRDVSSRSRTTALASARQLGEKPWSPAAPGEPITHFAAVDSAIARAALLERLGMDVEARFEYDALDDAAGEDRRQRLAATAHAFAEHGQIVARDSPRAEARRRRPARRARRIGCSFRCSTATSSRATPRRNDLDPALVAGLIRQESSFNPRAVSVADARGLMQVLPSVGQEVRASLRFPVWYPALLLDPDANLQLGTAHLASFIKAYGALPRVLAAYNAGGSRVTRWVDEDRHGRPELFAERIPFAETRDYVRLVQRNARGLSDAV